MGRLRVNRILISPDFLPQDFSGISPATQAVSYRNGEFFNQRSCDLIEDGGRVVVILDFIIKMKMMVFNSCIAEALISKTSPAPNMEIYNLSNHRLVIKVIMS